MQQGIRYSWHPHSSLEVVGGTTQKPPFFAARHGYLPERHLLASQSGIVHAITHLVFRRIGDGLWCLRRKSHRPVDKRVGEVRGQTRQ
jgi:hypothetical protein